MKSEFITQEVFIEIHPNSEVPIFIDAAGSFINLTFDELEKCYLYAKENL